MAKISERGVAKQNPFEKRLRSVDVSDLKSDFDSWPVLAEQSWVDASTLQMGGDLDRVLLTGMGGSGIVGELISDIARETGSPIDFATVKDYHLPPSVDKRTLVVGVSCSGNTEETLSVLAESHERGLTACTFGSGGAIERLSRERWNFPFTKTRMLKVPRSSLPGLFFPVLKLLLGSRILKIDEADVKEAMSVSAEVQRSCSKLHSKNAALRLAEEIAKEGSCPVIYAGRRTRAVGLRARQSLNENAKIHVFNGEVPELCHNEIVAWDSLSTRKRGVKSRDRRTVALMLRLEDDLPEISTRFEIIEGIIRKRKGRSMAAPSFGSSYLSRVFSMLYFLDYVSYYVAVFRGVDPMRTPSIDLLKGELSQRLNYLAHLV